MPGEYDQHNIFDAISAYYSAGREIDRLFEGIGQLEYGRKKELILRNIGPPPAVIYDVGGGVGTYAVWLAAQGYRVVLSDIVEDNLRIARDKVVRSGDHRSIGIVSADACKLPNPENSADVVLLLGPLYHLVDRKARQRALLEARRVLRAEGILFAAGISKYGSALYGLSSCSQGNCYLDDSEFLSMVRRELSDGQHIPPKHLPHLFTRAFFHQPSDFRVEVEQAGMEVIDHVAIEGPGWIVPDFDIIWHEDVRRDQILEMVRMVEHELELMGMSPHFMVIARKLHRK